MTEDRGLFFCPALPDDSPKAYVFGTMIRDEDAEQTRREWDVLSLRRDEDIAGLQSELNEACPGRISI
ncbi:hypothetical protein OE766_08330 [Pararhizobium sp. YC-54]|uniref:hypothetical protein n=1 Tax=Pararhizobium sp. YC-54 TaxID=2986920 RepID=UPI0021F6A652|nr:hypothetical protein [Pararhizobium sp. YC-54]MCV9998251.1 hypothetical protein [Pararhizobium sp. YC-54]